MRDKEHIEQVKFVHWIEKNHPDFWIYAVPNGGQRNKVTAIKLKAEGVRSGVPDLAIPKLFLYIEMKRSDGGIVSDNQKKWLSYLDGCGYRVAVANGFEEAKIIFLEVLNDFNSRENK